MSGSVNSTGSLWMALFVLRKIKKEKKIIKNPTVKKCSQGNLFSCFVDRCKDPPGTNCIGFPLL